MHFHFLALPFLLKVRNLHSGSARHAAWHFSAVAALLTRVLALPLHCFPVACTSMASTGPVAGLGAGAAVVGAALGAGVGGSVGTGRSGTSEIVGSGVGGAVGASVGLGGRRRVNLLLRGL